MNETLHTILKRKSVRKFENRPIEREKVELILRAAMSAPSARNQQPWAFVVIDDLALLKKLGNELPYAKMLLDGRLAIVVCGDLSVNPEKSEYWVQDCAAATQNILLAVESIGLGAVWTGVYPVAERIKTVRENLNLPENIIPLCVIPIGYPAVETSVIDKWKETNLHYNKW